MTGPESAEVVIKAIQALEFESAGRTATLPATTGSGSGARKSLTSSWRRKWAVAMVAAVALIGVGIWASGLISIPTRDGSFNVETDDPNFSFSISKGRVTLNDLVSKGTYDLKVVRNDRADEYEIEVTDTIAGLTFKSKGPVTIRRGDKVAVRAWFERKKQHGDDGEPAVVLPWDDQLAARRKLRGQRDEVEKGLGIAKVLRSVRSPLDDLDAATFPIEERLGGWPGLVAVLGEQKQRHWDGVEGVAVAANGTVASIGQSEVRIWEGGTMRLLRVLNGHRHSHACFGFDRQGRCQTCGRDLHICDHRIRHLYTLDHPLNLCCRLVHCSDPACPSRPRTFSPAAELTLALPGWDVFCFLGHRRFARHWSVPQILAELNDAYAIRLSPDAIANYVHHYQTMLAARQQDFDHLQLAYRDIDTLDLSIDGLQPEKGHETLYAVRELRAKRVWFAMALLSSTDAEVQQLLARAGEIANRLGRPIRLWLSDKQDAFVKGIARQFPGVPHLYCGNHFLRGLPKPTLEADSKAKVKMRKKVRGLRDVERAALNASGQAGAASTPAAQPAPPSLPTLAEVATAAVEKNPSMPREAAGSDPEPRNADAAAPARPADPASADSNGPAAAATGAGVSSPEATEASEAADSPGQGSVEAAAQRASGVVLDYCAAVRGILNDDQGGPLEPPGLRMAGALWEVRESVQRCLDVNKPGAARGQLERLAACIDAGLEEVRVEQQEVREQVKELQRVAATLEPECGAVEQRHEKYEELQQEYSQKEGAFYARLATVMLAWSAGLFGKVEGKCHGTTWSWRGGSGIPRGTKGGSTGTSTLACGSCRRGRRCCWPWMPTWSMTAGSPPRTCCPIATPNHPRTSNEPSTAARSCAKLALKNDNPCSET